MRNARDPRLTAVVLAGGRSRRMGTDNKLLLDVGGRPVVARVIDAFAALAAFDVVVVTGAEHERVAAVAQRQHGRVRVAHNADYETGMASSVRRGVQAASSHSRGFALCPGDLPLLSAATVARVCRAFDAHGEPRSIVRPVCGGRPGHPVLFGRGFREALLHLSGDVGARAVLARHERRLARVETDDDGIFRDVDTPEALRKVRQAWKRRAREA